MCIPLFFIFSSFSLLFHFVNKTQHALDAAVCQSVTECKLCMTVMHHRYFSATFSICSLQTLYLTRLYRQHANESNISLDNWFALKCFNMGRFLFWLKIAVTQLTFAANSPWIHHSLHRDNNNVIITNWHLNTDTTGITNYNNSWIITIIPICMFRLILSLYYRKISSRYNI